MRDADVAATHSAERKMLAFRRLHNAAEFSGVPLQKTPADTVFVPARY